MLPCRKFWSSCRLWASCALTLGLVGSSGGAIAASNPHTATFNPLFSDSSLEPLQEAAPLIALVRYRRRAYSRPAWGAPWWAYGGAARGDGCQDANASPVVPLVPIDVEPSDTPGLDGKTSFLGVTGQAFPSFLIYVPATTAVALDFLLVDEKRDTPALADGEVIYEQTIPLTETPGIVRFDLDASIPAQALTPDVHYTWSLSLICEETQTLDIPFVAGLIQRLPLSQVGLDAETATLDRPDRIDAYAAAGLWHETLTELADAYCENPDDAAIAQDWRSLLDSLELTNAPELVRQIQTDTIADAPLLWCDEG